ncbi:MAG: DinB family protein [Melioribacteraceae bacterium]|nr:DinB family protein [Melioribacteraceae bacterium]
MINIEKDLIHTIKKSVEKLLMISDETAAIKKSVGKWSQKEILGHLIDSANVNLNRFLSGIKSEDLIFDTYPQNDWVEVQNYNARNWKDLIDLWSALNLHITKLIGQIPEEVLNRSTNNHNFDKICWEVVPQNEETSLSYLIKDYIGHLEHHLKQIFNY